MTGSTAEKDDQYEKTSDLPPTFSARDFEQTSFVESLPYQHDQLKNRFSFSSVFTPLQQKNSTVFRIPFHLLQVSRYDQREFLRRGSRLLKISHQFLDKGVTVMYTIIGIGFLLGAFLVLIYSIWDVCASLFNLAAIAARNRTTIEVLVGELIVGFFSNLLFILIILGVLGTVINYLKSHTTSLRPFLFIGMIAATRGILSVGVRLSLERADVTAFTRNMVELGINAAIILIIGMTLKMLGKGDAEQ